MFDKDFTMEKYELLCQSISKSNFKTYTLEKLIDCNQKINASFIILRHDVDRSPKKAYMMAKIEQKYGLKATYYSVQLIKNCLIKRLLIELKN